MRVQYFRNNTVWIIWLLLYFIVNIILFVEAAVQHRSMVRDSTRFIVLKI